MEWIAQTTISGDKEKIMEHEYEIGHVVLFHEWKNGIINGILIRTFVGWVTDKYVDDENILRYTIEWNDGFVDNFYDQKDVDTYTQNLVEYERSLHT